MSFIHFGSNKRPGSVFKKVDVRWKPEYKGDFKGLQNFSETYTHAVLAKTRLHMHTHMHIQTQIIEKRGVTYMKLHNKDIVTTSRLV